MNNVNRIIKSVRKTETPTIHEQISTHKLQNGNACFKSKTKRNNRVSTGPGPGMYEADYKHSYLRKNPQGFGSTTERQYLVNRNVLDSPFWDPTSVNNPGVGSYNKDKKFKKNEEKSRVKKIRENLSQNRAVTLANAKGMKMRDLDTNPK